MATIEERRNQSGSLSYRVAWHLKGQAPAANAGHDKKEAQDWKRLPDLRKADQNNATRDLAKLKHTGPTMTEVFKHWIERHRGSIDTIQN